MAICFLFSQHQLEENLLSLKLDSQGQIAAPLASRSTEEFKALQDGAETVVIVSAERCSLHELPLPWLAERKARAAIPYALEEQLAQTVSTLHFAFDRQHYKDNIYLVVVIDKDYLSGLIEKLDALEVAFDKITIDWFALNDGESCITHNNILVNDSVFKGALSGELASIYLHSSPQTEIFLFNDSADYITDQETTKIDENALVWIAKRLHHNKPINLCQGAFQRGDQRSSIQFWYRAGAVLIGVWLLSLLILNTAKVIMLNHKIDSLDQEIAVIYREFFPEAKQVISPRFRIEQSLKSSADSQKSEFWSLLAALSKTYNPDNATIQQLLFQNKTLSVTLLTKDFVTLEALQQTLQQANIKVTQTQASSQDGQVIATLELKL